MKRTVPLLITFFIGVVMIIHYFSPALADVADLGSIHFDILAGIAYILGGGNLLRSHSEKVFKQRPGWGYSGVTLFFFFLTLGVGLLKVNVTPQQGVSTALQGQGSVNGMMTLNIADGEKYELRVALTGLTKDSAHDVVVGGETIGRIVANKFGRADLTLVHPGDDQTPPEMIQPALVNVAAGEAVRIGPASGMLEAYGRITGDHLDNGSAFWFLYEFGFKPLQATTFAMLAFYVASAAFRAFRARNVESVLLLGTAFVILMGRTYLGTLLTLWLPQDPMANPAGFFTIPHLTQWIMMVFNTAGSRAIMIGIALGVASTSLKVLLGIDRSYLGSDRE